MTTPPSRPPVRIRFRYNLDTGEIEEFLIDDNAPHLSEGYHNKIAGAIAANLARHPDIEDAGPRGATGPRLREGSVDRLEKKDTQTE